MAILSFQAAKSGRDKPGREAVLVLLLLLLSLFPSRNGFAERLKDIAYIEGMRDNQLVGYGLVVGLNGTGDKGKATLQSISNMLLRMGLTVNPKDVKAKNAASVIVTATLPPFPRNGNRIDAIVSALADAKSLEGGTLLMTPLRGPDGKVYGMAQGPVSIGGFSAGGGGASIQKNHPTVGRVPNGVLIEREVTFDLNDRKEVKVLLREPDFTVASNAMREINRALKGGYAEAVDPSTIRITVPDTYQGRVVEFVRLIEHVNVEVDRPARVVINERTGTVIIGENVKISPVAIAHGGLTIEVRTDFLVSQPEPFSRGKTTVVPETSLTAEEKKAHLMKVSGATLGEVVRALNAMGVTSRDLIAILQALKAAGALKAELEII